MGLDLDDLLANIDIAYQHLKNWYPDSSFSPTEKSNAESTRLRKIGNEKFKAKEDWDALDLYTQSVAWATEDGEELAFAYSNRSAVLFRLQKYVPCLLDVNRALKGKFSEDLKKKILDRKKKCLAMIKSKTIKADGTDPVEVNDNIPEWRSELQNSLLPNTSSKIKLASDEKWGRYMVAAKDIEPGNWIVFRMMWIIDIYDICFTSTGEILSCEEFYSTVAYPDRMFSNCSYCFVKCEALIPCFSCPKVCFLAPVITYILL